MPSNVRLIGQGKKYYPHYCYTCGLNYFGEVDGKVEACPRCKSTDVIDNKGNRFEKSNCG